MKETESRLASSGAPLEAKRHRVVRQLTADIDHLKREIERSMDMRNRSRILSEFERPLPLNHVKKKCVDILTVPARKTAVEEMGKVEMVMDYALDANALALVDVLKHSKKVVFSSEWEIGYKENKIVSILDKVDRARRKNRLFRASEEAGISKAEPQKIRNMILGMDAEKRGKLKMIKRELESVAEKAIVYEYSSMFSSGVDTGDRAMNAACDNRSSHADEHQVVRMGEPCEINNGSGIIQRTVDDNPQNIFVSSIQSIPIPEKKISSKTGVLDAFKRYLNNFSKCNSSQSSRSGFRIGFPSAGIHPTNQHIFKKVPAEHLRCRSVKEIVDYKYRNVVVEKAVLKPKSSTSRGLLDILDESSPGDLCSSKSDEDELEFSFFLKSSPGGSQHRHKDMEQPEKMNLETPFDKFLNERSRRGKSDGMGSSLHSNNPKFTDFIKTSGARTNSGDTPAHPKLINEFHRSFPGRTDSSARISFETIKSRGRSDEEERKAAKDKHQIT